MGAVGKVGLKPHTAQVSIIDFDKEYEIFDLEAFLHSFQTQLSPTKIYDYYLIITIILQQNLSIVHAYCCAGINSRYTLQMKKVWSDPPFHSIP